MILELFGVLAAIALFTVWFGYYTNEGVYTLVGLTFLFLLGMHLMVTGLSYETGYTESSVVTGNTTNNTVANTYGSFEGEASHWYGFLLAALGAGGFAFVWGIGRREEL